MAAQNLLMRISLVDLTGLPRDTVQMSLSAIAAAPISSGDAAGYTSLVAGFFTGTYVGATVSQFIADSVDRTALKHRLDIYDVTAALNGSPHGSPIFSNMFSLNAATGITSLPSECAAVLTYLAAGYATKQTKGPIDAATPTPESAIDYGAPAVHSAPTNPKARYRGRIYLGPLNINAREGSPTTTHAQVSQTLINTALNAFEGLIDGLEGAANPATVAVWSRRDAAMHPVTTVNGEAICQMDNAFDTQRRRGSSATAKTVLAEA